MSESFGRYLKRERKLREIALEDIARETKIKVGLLRALEDDRIRDLPSPAIVKGFLRAYARMLGLSANDLQLRYHAFLEEVAPDRLRPQSLRPWVPGKRRRLGPVGWLLLIALVVGVGLHLTGAEPARGPSEDDASSGADSRVVYRKNYLDEMATQAPPGTPPHVAAASPEWPGPASGGVTVILRAVAPTAASVSLDGAKTQPIVLLPGQPVLRHAFRGMVIDAQEPAFLEVEANGERLAPGGPGTGPSRIVLRAPELSPTGEEFPSRLHPAASLQADAAADAPLPAFPSLGSALSLADRLAEAPPRRAKSPRPGPPAAEASGDRRPGAVAEPLAESPQRPSAPVPIPTLPSNSEPTGR